MRKVLLVASDKGELKGFGDGYIKVVSGVGPIMSAAASALWIEREKPDLVVSIGSAGAINPALEIGEAYSFSSVVTPDQDLSAFHVAKGSTLDERRTTIGEIRTLSLDSGLRLSSSASFTSDTSEFLEKMHVDATDMEAYGVAVACRKMEVEFASVKLITDIVGDKSGVGKVSFNLRRGRERLIELVDSICLK